ncbi:uncharacterized protein FOMMEDRAFT_155515 [Fomitiporia mediterranea MF3/22]|uniref:uncharacterized protein n=1 Tax=Fomitiporia mediterranea (strain MF3/22) TaxID=694068 RepID=UPI00044076DF|nr:uncharacterized protein FOMMEDRAFT_155515 [Fomitiporia mediterranea MF3/22]EJD04385.1 hypothetical protein FOMMEDRAFT_155515 [Fomitiporia mediterranea MF3/22]
MDAGGHVRLQNTGRIRIANTEVNGIESNHGRHLLSLSESLGFPHPTRPFSGVSGLMLRMSKF